VGKSKVVFAYCVAEQQSQIDLSIRGVEGAPVNSIDAGVLRCFLSDCSGRTADELRPEMVTAFNRVLQRIFSQTAIIPFRFPTIVESEEVLRHFVDSRCAEYAHALERLRNKVQLDVRITLKPGNAPETSLQSGRSYLDEKRGRYQQAQSTLEEFRRVSDSCGVEWIERDTSSGIRAFALVDRYSLPVFLKKIARVITPADISARVTGPWPPSEFV
jgi:hypothetical protein